MPPSNITHVITGLDAGGAEMMLYKLLSLGDRARFAPSVVSLTTIGDVGERIKALGVPVHALGMARGLPDPVAVLRLAVRLRRARPALVQTWMYHADLVGGLAAKLAGGIPVVWGIRQSNLNPAGNRRMTRAAARLGARLSHWVPARIVCCSESGRRVHEAMGYNADKMIFIPNGFDTAAFAPDEAARVALRRELGVASDALLIGLAARFHPQKDHLNFIRAAALLHGQRPDVHFVLCGEGVTRANRELGRWMEDAGIGSCCHLLGRRADMASWNAALDVAASSSAWGEGFPNIVGEAMACGVPCTVTDVGDAAVIVADTGRVVPPRDPQALAAAWGELLTMPAQTRRALGVAARRRIEEHYGLRAVVARYESLYGEILARCAA